MLLLILAGGTYSSYAQSSDCEFISKFSLDIKEVISMYADNTAFYLHTENVLYVVSRDEGKILSSDSSKVKYGCFENGVLYTHTETEDGILNQYGDTILRLVPGDNNRGKILSARCMCVKKGIFYWYMGHRNHGGRSDCFYQVTKEGTYTHLGFWNGGVKGMAVKDDYLLVLRRADTNYLSLISKDIVDNQKITSHIIEDNSQTLPNLNLVGLVLEEEGAYTWSNTDQTMYVIPQPFITKIATFIHSKRMADNLLYYDLLGRPVSHPTSGIYIQNGKKVMVR